MTDLTIRDALAQAHTLPDVTPLEAQVLLSHVTGQERSWLLAHDDAPLTGEQVTQYRERIRRLAAGEPLAYLTGTRAFCGMDFAVTPDVLVPRPDTEQLVYAVIDWVSARPHPQPLSLRERGAEGIRLIDVGTGSGIIAVSLAAMLPDARVTATDLSEAALTVARANAERHGVADRLRFVQTDLLAGIEGLFDVIAANLPYIARPDLPSLSVAQWEPVLALDGGADGLDLIRRLFQQTPQHLAGGGALFLEIGYDQGERAAALCRAAFPGASVHVLADLAELDRVIIVDTSR